MKQFTCGNLGEAYKILVDLAEEDDINYRHYGELAGELGRWYVSLAADNAHNDELFGRWMGRAITCFFIEAHHLS